MGKPDKVIKPLVCTVIIIMVVIIQFLLSRLFCFQFVIIIMFSLEGVC